MQVATFAFHGLRFDGLRNDVGNKLGFLKTNITFARQYDDVREALIEYLKETVEQSNT